MGPRPHPWDPSLTPPYDDTWQVMYYPSMAYFSDVLRKCAKCLRPGGSVYIGCCRSLEHLQHFHTDVTLFNADDENAPALELRRACLNRRMKEKELLTSPGKRPGLWDPILLQPMGPH